MAAACCMHRHTLSPWGLLIADFWDIEIGRNATMIEITKSRNLRCPANFYIFIFPGLPQAGRASYPQRRCVFLLGCD